MKRRTKAIVLTLIAAMLLTGAASTSALAQPGDTHAEGIYDVKVYEGATLEPCEADGTKAEEVLGQLTGGPVASVYADAVRFRLTFSGVAGQQYVVFVLSDNGSQIPTEDNIKYVNQYVGAGTVNCDLYPSEIAKGSYDVYVSGNNEYKKVASFKSAGEWTETDVISGDVNSDNHVDSRDALLALQISVETYTPNSKERTSADVNGDNIIDSRDALQILKMSVGLE